MSFYRVTPGESPAMIARKLGTSVSALMHANGHKPTSIVNGKRTFAGLRFNELLHRPRSGAGALGESGTLGITPADPNAPHALIASGSYGPDVALWQKIIGVTADGSFGSGTAAATKAWQSAHGLPNDGVVGPNTWAKALGNASSAPLPVSASAPAASSPSLSIAAGAAFTALGMDPNYCTSVARAGTPVNTAVHNFKAAWNAANPSRKVPIGTGKYEGVVAAALSSALSGVAVPPGCDGAATAPIPVASAQPAPVAPPAPGPAPAAPAMPPPVVTPVVTPSPTPAPTVSSGYSGSQIAAATAMNSALAAHGYKQGDQSLYAGFQRAMGLKADGYPGAGTMAKLATVLAAAGVPMASVHVYPWRAGAYDGVNAPTQSEWSGAAPAVPSAPSAGTAPAPSSGGSPGPSAGGVAPSAPAAGGGGGGLVVPETKKGLSTGAIVVGALGATAVVGLLAAAAMKPKHKGGGTRRRKSSKSAHHKPTHKAKRKTRKKK